MGGRGRFPCALASLVLVGAAFAAVAKAEETIKPSCAEGSVRDGGTIYGTPCDDRIVVPPGVARVNGGAGDDVIVPAPITEASSCPEGCRLGVGSQTFEGGPGDDVVYGERGNDRLFGGGGNDQLFGGIGDDLLRGGPGSDRLSGGFGADSIDGEADGDYVRGDATQDTIVDTGASGDDTLSYSTGVTPGFFDGHALDPAASKNLPSHGGERGVYLDLSANEGDDGVAPTGGGIDKVEGDAFETVIGTPFSDYIVGDEKGETIYGGGGADVIFGEGGDDTLHGGADGDHLDGGEGADTADGDAGSDHCANATEIECESAVNTGGVVPRDTSEVSVGAMAPELGTGSQLYLTGSEENDTVVATYSATPAPRVTFALAPGSAQFDAGAAAASGCEPPAPTQVVCPLSAPLDSLVLAGMGGDDSLRASGFPPSVSVITAGGEGDDHLTGEDSTEDVLVDGPDESGPGDDVLDALGGDDALLNNGGVDHLSGGAGNDLFLSNSICDGDTIDGGGGSERDNASWAKFKAGVEARIGSGVGDAGEPGAGGAPECASGSLDSLVGIEDLEGTASGDVFYGGPGDNQLLGWAGSDSYFAGGGNDVILANSGDDDGPVDCGEGTDTALVDKPPHHDAVAANCETVQEAEVNSFRIETKLPPPLEEAAEGAAPAPGPIAKPPPKPKPLPGACLSRPAHGRPSCGEKPRRLSLGALGRLEAIHWRGWGSRSAVGLGRLRLARHCCGRPGVVAARVTASGRVTCGTRRWYTRLSIAYRRPRLEPFVRRLIGATPCDG